MTERFERLVQQESEKEDVKYWQEKVNPIEKWILERPKLKWFLSVKNIALLSVMTRKRLKHEFPHDSKEELDRKGLEACYTIMLEFATSHGYSEK